MSISDSTSQGDELASSAKSLLWRFGFDSDLCSVQILQSASVQSNDVVTYVVAAPANHIGSATFLQGNDLIESNFANEHLFLVTLLRALVVVGSAASGLSRLNNRPFPIGVSLAFVLCGLLLSVWDILHLHLPILFQLSIRSFPFILYMYASKVLFYGSFRSRSY
jgi:hypothetical protein